MKGQQRLFHHERCNAGSVSHRHAHWLQVLFSGAPMRLALIWGPLRALFF